MTHAMAGEDPRLLPLGGHQPLPQPPLRRLPHPQWPADPERASQALLERRMHARDRVAQVDAQADAVRQAMDGDGRRRSVLALAGAAGRAQPRRRTAMAFLLRRVLDPEWAGLRG